MENESNAKEIAGKILSEENQRSAPQGNTNTPEKENSQTQPQPVTPAAQSNLPLPDIDVPASLLSNEPAKPPEAKPAQPEQEPDEIKNANTKTREAFAHLRTQLSQATEELKQLRAKPAGEQQPAVDVQQVVEMKNKMDELNKKLNDAYDQIGKFSLESDPRFKAKYEGQQQAILEQIKDLAKEWEVKEGAFDKILQSKPKQRVELINEIAPDLMPILSPLFAQYDHIERVKQMELANHKSVKSQLESEAQKTRAISEQTGKVALLQQAAVKVLKDGHFLLQPVQGNDAWNKGVEVLQKKIQYLFSHDDPAAQSEHLVLGVMAPVYLKLFKRERQAKEEIEKKLQQITGMRPSLDAQQSDALRKKQDTIDASSAVKKVLAEEFQNNT